MHQSKKIAIVYDWLDKWGGVERVLLTLNNIFPKADFFTSYYDREKAGWAKNLKIKTSFIQKLPDFIKGSRIASLPLYPYAFESFNFSGYDLVISVTSSFAKAVVTRPEALHICYLLTPTRYLWVSPDNYIKNSIIRTMLSSFLEKLRNWDFIAAQRPDRVISISQTVAGRCKKYYQRESEIIFPPFDIEYWKKIKSQLSITNFQTNFKFPITNFKKYFLVVSRLESYKKIDLVVQLINRLSHLNLVIVGEGSEMNRLKNIAGENVVFLNKVSDQELGHFYSKAEALIMPQEEDFGYVSLEAQFFGCPVIAYKRGGAVETVIEGKTGIFFAEQTVESLQSAIKRFDMIKYDIKHNTVELGQKNVARFDKQKFIKYFKQVIS